VPHGQNTSEPPDPPRRGRLLPPVLTELIRQAREARLGDVAAHLAFDAMLAIFPFAIFLVTVVAFLPIHGLEDELTRLVREAMPAESAALLDGTIHSVVRSPNPRLLAISLAGSMWAATGGVNALTHALNKAYGVRETRGWVHVRLRALAITLLAVVLVIVGTASLLVGPSLVHRAAIALHLGDAPGRIYAVLRWPSIVITVSLALALLYWACPNVRQRFRFVTPGAALAVPLWIGLSLGFNVYLDRLGAGRFDRTYGALGAGVVLMLWLYLVATIVLLGGMLNAVIAREHGEAITEG
jgi:membrane protein